MKKQVLAAVCAVAASASACSSLARDGINATPETVNVNSGNSYQSLMAKADGLYTSFGTQAEETRSALERLEIFRRFAFTYAAAVGIFEWHADNASAALLVGGLAGDWEDVFHHEGASPWTTARARVSCVQANLGPMLAYEQATPPTMQSTFQYGRLYGAADAALEHILNTALADSTADRQSAQQIAAAVNERMGEQRTNPLPPLPDGNGDDAGQNLVPDNPPDAATLTSLLSNAANAVERCRSL